jgi:hypothetical protein
LTTKLKTKPAMPQHIVITRIEQNSRT